MPHMGNEIHSVEESSSGAQAASSPLSPVETTVLPSPPRAKLPTRSALVRRVANAVKLARAAQTVPGPLRLPTLFRIVRRVSAYTMVPYSGLIFAIQRAAEAALAGRGGAIVECVVWRGGSSFAMALAQKAACGRVVCPVHMLDSFEGLPPVTERDGPAAAAWQRSQDPTAPDAFLRTPEHAVRATARRLGFTEEEVVIHRGWFAATAAPLARQLAKRGGVALLRLDGDWYDSTIECLEAFGPALLDGAIIVVDDYYYWDGCARAVHDWLSRHDLPWRIRTIPRQHGAWLTAETAPPRPEPVGDLASSSRAARAAGSRSDGLPTR